MGCCATTQSDTCATVSVQSVGARGSIMGEKKGGGSDGGSHLTATRTLPADSLDDDAMTRVQRRNGDTAQV